MKNKRLLGSLLLTLTAIIWGTAFVFQRSGMDRIEPITFNAARLTLSTAAVGLVALLQRKKPAFSDAAEEKTYKKSTVIGGVLCGVFLSAASTLQQMGLVYTTAGKAGFITSLYILIVPVVSLIVFKKRGTPFVWIGVPLGVLGMYLLCITESFRLARGDLLILACAVFFSCHILTCDRFAPRGNPIRISAIQFAVATTVSWIAAFITETPSVEKITSAAVPIVFCGIVSGGVGYTLQITAQRFTDPTVASLLMSLESVFAVISGALILHERMSARELIGCAVMFCAIVIVQLPVPGKKKRQRQDNGRTAR